MVRVLLKVAVALILIALIWKLLGEKNDPGVEAA